MGLTRHTLEITDAVFTGGRLFKMTNQVVGSTLTAMLNVSSFTGGIAPAVTLRMFYLGDDGERLGNKMNGGTGEVTAAGLHTLIFGPNGTASGVGDDKNTGALPRNFQLELLSPGDQDSADLTLDVVIS
jgi:hypothetical protein